MMKSFFKKLAFVMALAMVVSLAAPAGSALAADYSLNVTVQGTKDVITEYNLAKVGDEVDFQFWKAPSNWATDYKWDVTRPGVVEVDQSGVVKALAEGTTAVTITVLGTYYGEVEVTVGEKVAEVTPVVTPEATPEVTPDVTPEPTPEVVDNSYVYNQVSHDTATFTFNKDVSFTADDVTLTKIFNGEYEVNWPIETVKCDKNVVTVSPFVDFADGDVYVIRIGAADVEGTKFTTKLGVVDYIEISYKSMGEDGVAYAKFSEDDPDVEVELSCKLFSGGVDVTKAEGYDVSEVEFELKTESDDYDLDGNILIFENAKSVAIVKAIYAYEVDDEEKELEIEAPVYPTPLTPYGIKSIDKWTIVKDDIKEIDWSSVDHDIPALDDEKANYEIVVLMTDTYGNKIVYPNYKCKDYAGKKVYTLDDVKTSNSADDNDLYIEAAENFEIRYKSTNDNKLFVGTYEGDITTIVGDVDVPVLVSLYDKNDEGDTYLVKTLLAPTVEVDPARKADKISVTSGDNATLPTAGDFTKGTVEFTVVDQYGDPYTAGVSVAISESNDKVDIGGKATLVKESDGKYSFEFDGTDFIDTKDKVVDSIKFTAKVNDNVKTTFTVKAKAPETKDGAFVINGYAIEVKDVDQKVKEDDGKGNVVSTAITVYELSKGLKVAIAKDVKLVTADNENKGLLKDGKTFQANSSQAEEGEIYLAVFGKDGKAISAAASSTALGITGSAGKYTVNVAVANGNTMTYLDAIDYTVDLYEIAKEYTTDKLSKLDTYTETFNVKNTSATVKLDKQLKSDLTGLSNPDIKDIVVNGFQFTTFKWDDVDAESVITGVKYKYNEGSGRVYVYYVNFLVPLNAKGDTVGYKVEKVAVNKYVEVDGFDASIKSVE